MQKRQEMYDKLIKKINENILATANRIEQYESHMPTDGKSHPSTYNFITELKAEIYQWNEIKEEIHQLKLQKQAR